MADDRPLPLLPDQRPPKFPASLGACLTRNGDETHLRILHRQFGDWTSRQPIYLLNKKRESKLKSESPRKKGELKMLSESHQQVLLRNYIKEYGESIHGSYLRLRYIKRKESSEWSFIEMYLHVKKDMKDILVFNPYNFIYDQPIQQISEKLRRALTILPTLRTPSDILLILTFLRNIRCFKDYPPYTQIELCKCMILQTYESRRIVVKQGQPASSFYIIKSGTLLINVTETNLHTGKTFYRSCAELRDGDCFGEVGLLERCNRTASVICKTDCQLLLILQDDFDRLIRQPLMKQKQEHIDFCRKDSVITSEAGDFKYLIVIMTGKCRLVSCIEVDKNGDISSNITRSNKKNSFKTRGDIEVLTQKLPPIKRARSSSVTKDTTFQQKQRRSGSVPNLHQHLLKSKTFYPDLIEEDGEDEDDDDDDSGSIHIKVKVYDSASFDLKGGLSDGKKGEDLVRKVEDKLQISHYNRLLKKAAVSQRLRKSVVKESTDYGIYAQLAELTSGSVFGLESIVNGGRKGLKIISDGVECIFVSKRLFLEEANIKVLSIVNDMMMTFPSDEEITNQVQEKRSWYNYKQKIFKSSLKYSKYLYRQKTVL
ncbi:hypothetical protein LOTGIDRAFT_170791 [Lottia gigantea]|uniref:Cyclic nucleotide-binding domain-containing protein n=1 Tax=Lottia gigantea TaxID=225164 RepID=V4CPR4_LOTGI|nr:hypothetical protein LOTGIDRAFT_170791 [Lottia gigantea]ESP04400.1 hypothetical protein LOTGIDRAFT_170791 [Lottia gigantea]